MKNKNIYLTSFIALFGAIVCVGCFIKIPIGVIPIVLQNVLCILTGAIPTAIFLRESDRAYHPCNSWRHFWRSSNCFISYCRIDWFTCLFWRNKWCCSLDGTYRRILAWLFNRCYGSRIYCRKTFCYRKKI